MIEFQVRDILKAIKYLKFIGNEKANKYFIQTIKDIFK